MENMDPTGMKRDMWEVQRDYSGYIAVIIIGVILGFSLMLR